MSVDPQAADLLALAVDIANEAAAVVAKYAAERTYVVETKSTPTDLVTEADRETEALIVRRILSARPGDGLLGEEGANREAASGIRWVIDPIDGTTNFVLRHPGL